jgi:hypothetical protein
LAFPWGKIKVSGTFVSLSDPNFAWHLRPDSLCIDAGDPCKSYAGEQDIDADGRVHNNRVDIGADEAGCGDVYNALDWNHDGIVNMTEFAVFARSWKGRDPSGPPFDPNLWPNPWNATVNLHVDFVIDMEDLRIFCQSYLWMACWHPPIRPIPTQPLAGGAHGSSDPNEPYDPNEWTDPNDPNGFGMMSMQANGLSIEMDSLQLYDPVMEAQQLQDCIDFLYEAAAGENPDDAAIIYEFIPTLEDALSEIYGTNPEYDFTQ